MQNVLLVLLTLSTAFCASKPKKETPPKPNAIKLFQESWDKVETFQSNFKQAVTSKQIGGMPDETEGVLSIIRPDKLRWESTTDGGIQILNGKQLTSIRPNRRRKNATVTIYEDISKQGDIKSLSFLAGKVDFESLYDIKILKDEPEKAELKLTPKKGTESYIAEIDKKSYLLASLTTETVESKVVVMFKDIKTNTPLEKTLFEYTPGPTDIVHRQK